MPGHAGPGRHRGCPRAAVGRHKPKPTVDAQPPKDITDSNEIIARARQLYDIMYLALLTDSTRLITYSVGDSNSVAKLPGVSMNYHDLSHHGQDEEKLKQLATIESEHVEAFGDFIRRLKESAEGDSNLLARTMVLIGSHMHSGGHDNRNLPISLPAVDSSMVSIWRSIATATIHLPIFT